MEITVEKSNDYIVRFMLVSFGFGGTGDGIQGLAYARHTLHD
jgi:hypothetical protein